MTTVETALREAREAALAHMVKAGLAGLTWSEPAVTEIYLASAHGKMRSVAFNSHEEPTTGADWLWWCVDGAGEAFGMLVQAKRIHWNPTRATFDFTHRIGEARVLQFDRLVEAADVLGVPPVYALYCGDPAERRGLRCSRMHRQDECEACSPATVSLVSELAVRQYLTTTVAPADDVLQYGVPAEYISRENIDHWATLWLSEFAADPELERFLLEPQDGARRVARHVFEVVARARYGQLELATADQAAEQLTDARVFRQLPSDTGHFSEPYFETILRGLRSAPPDYVAALIAGENLGATDVPGPVDGVAVLTLDS